MPCLLCCSYRLLDINLIAVVLGTGVQQTFRPVPVRVICPHGRFHPIGVLGCDFTQAGDRLEIVPDSAIRGGPVIADRRGHRPGMQYPLVQRRESSLEVCHQPGYRVGAAVILQLFRPTVHHGRQPRTSVAVLGRENVLSADSDRLQIVVKEIHHLGICIVIRIESRIPFA